MVLIDIFLALKNSKNVCPDPQELYNSKHNNIIMDMSLSQLDIPTMT